MNNARVTFCALMFALGSAGAARGELPVVSFWSDLHSDQCSHALRYGEWLRTRGAAPNRVRSITADGWLCRGLRGDVWGAQRALSEFRDLARAQSSDVFAQLGFAEAVRYLYPASEEAIESLDRLIALLPRADVGDARAALAEHATRNRLSAMLLRQRTLQALVAMDALGEGVSDATVLQYTRLAKQLGESEHRSALIAVQRLIEIRGRSLSLLAARADLGAGVLERGDVVEDLRWVAAEGCSAEREGLSDAQVCEEARRLLLRFDSAKYALDVSHGSFAGPVAFR